MLSCITNDIHSKDKGLSDPDRYGILVFNVRVLLFNTQIYKHYFHFVLN